MTIQEKLAALERLDKAVSNTNIAPVNDTKLDLYAKLEFQLFGGSTKMRSAYAILKSALEANQINADTTVIESSSGNFAIAMSMLCNIVGIKFIPVVDLNTNLNTIQFLRNFAHDVVVITDRDDRGGYLLNRLRYIHDRLKDDNVFWTRQYENENNFLAHYNGTGTEIIQQMPDIEYVFIAAGTCGSLSGISTKIKEHNSNIKIIAVDVLGSVIFSEFSKKRFIPGMGSSIKPPLLAKSNWDDVVLVDEIDAVQGCWDLFHTGYIYAGGSSGTVYSAIQQYFKDKTFDSKPKVLFVCPDGGRYYNDTVYNKEWIKQTYDHETSN